MLQSNPFAGGVTGTLAIALSHDSPLDRCLVVPLTSLAAAAPRL
jgi:hypothetical protein